VQDGGVAAEAAKMALPLSALAYSAHGRISGIVAGDGGLPLLLIAPCVCRRGWTAGPRLIRAPR
jgi:hypothetical protein